MKILVTNDDGYRSLGIKVLVEILRPFGEITVVAPKTVQSGMSMAVTIGDKPIAVKKVSETVLERWFYLDGTPASCVKFGYGVLGSPDSPPDLVVSGINHGGNYASAALYSGTVGAAQEAALSGIPAIAVSLDDLYPAPDDFNSVRAYFPRILRKLLDNPSRKFGTVYNINFPAGSASDVKGIRVCRPGVIRWIREYEPYVHRGEGPVPVPEEGEVLYRMGGEVEADPDNAPDCDFNLVSDGLITITALNIVDYDAKENSRLKSAGLEKL